MLILDADLLTVVQRTSGDEYETLVRRLDVADDLVCVTIISFEEQMRGWLAYIARARQVVKQLPAHTRLHQLIEDFGTTNPSFRCALARSLRGIQKAQAADRDHGSQNRGDSGC